MANLATELRRIREVVERAKADLLDALSWCDDLAFLGSASKIYKFEPCRLVDLDVWILLSRLDSASCQRVAWSVEQVAPDSEDTQFSFEAVDGPYKPAKWHQSEDHLFIHLLLDTAQSYQGRSTLTRYCWRKYSCQINQELLRLWAPRMITRKDLLKSRFGLEDCLKMLRSGSVEYEGIRLRSGSRIAVSYPADTPEFVEFCFYAAMTSARNLARFAGYVEPDRLSTTPFAQWYAEVFNSQNIVRMAELKMAARQEGYSVARTDARELALGIVEDMSSRIR